MNRIRRVLSRIKKSDSGKTLAKNFGYLSILELTSHFFPLITTPYLARVIGVDGFGVLAVGAAIVAYFQSLTNYGFTYTSVRDASRNRNDIMLFSRIVSVTFFSKGVLMLLSILILFGLTFSIPFLRENSLVIWVTFLLIPGHVLNPDWVFQALEDMKYITVRSIIAKGLFTILVFFFIKEPSDYLWQPILTAFGTFAPSVWGLWVLKKKYRIVLMRPSFHEIINYLKDGFNMFVTVFLPTIYTKLNTLLLGSYNGKTATGIYDGGTKFTSIAYHLFQLASRAFFPFFARRLDKHKYYALFSFVLSLGISFFFFAFARPIVLVFLGPQFEETIKVLRIVAFTPIAMSLMNSYGVNYLVLKGKEKLMSRIMIFVTCIGIIMGIWGAKYYSYIGVAVASLSTQTLRALLITFFAIRNEKQQKAV